MEKFRIGDRVRLIKLLDWHETKTNIRVGDCGTVVEASKNPFILMDKKITFLESILDHNDNKICCTESQLELITDSKPTNTVTIILGNTAYEITGENITIKTKQL